jgi:hypothetical protein
MNILRAAQTSCAGNEVKIGLRRALSGKEMTFILENRYLTDLHATSTSLQPACYLENMPGYVILLIKGREVWCAGGGLENTLEHGFTT